MTKIVKETEIGTERERGGEDGTKIGTMTVIGIGGVIVIGTQIETVVEIETGIPAGGRAAEGTPKEMIKISPEDPEAGE